MGTRRQGVERGVSKAGAGRAVNDITIIMMIVLCKHLVKLTSFLSQFLFWVQVIIRINVIFKQSNEHFPRPINV